MYEKRIRLKFLLLKRLQNLEILMAKTLACVTNGSEATCAHYVSQFPSKGRAILICHSYLNSPSVLNLSPYSDF